MVLKEMRLFTDNAFLVSYFQTYDIIITLIDSHLERIKL